MLKEFKKVPVVFQVAIAAGAAYAVYRIFKAPPPEQITQVKVIDDVKKRIDAGERSTYDDSQYNSWADSLAAAMFDVGTNTDTIYAVMKRMKSNLDILKLIAAFGIRPYYWFGWKQGDYNLSQWFSEELNAGNYAMVNSILDANNLTARF